jgi:hypothetical protein
MKMKAETKHLGGRARLGLGATAAVAVVVVLGTSDLFAQDMPAGCPLHAQHMQAVAEAPDHGSKPDFAAIDARGDQVMGFAHGKTTHHFLLDAEGGAIEVSVNDAADAESRAQIRAHLQEVERDFRAGNFEMPLAVHGRQPAGVGAMRAQGEGIRYRYRETSGGGRVELEAAGAAAVAAVHAFLRFQIVEHRTGDSLEPAVAN